MLRPGPSGAAASPLPRPRTLIHPGRFNPVRIQSKHSDRARHIRLAVQPGHSLFDAHVTPLAEIGVKNASTTILGGWFADLHYCVAPPDPSGKAVRIICYYISITNNSTSKHLLVIHPMQYGFCCWWSMGLDRTAAIKS